MRLGYGARTHVNNGQVEVTVSCEIDGQEHYITCPVGDGMYFAQRALEAAVALARDGGIGKTLADAVITDERQHGGLLSRDTLTLANVVKKG